ncbi:MAG: HDIG domain-containing protein, partial [Candidatus Omnitrophica bacterium]|nr:HDIG domain-containing protein [Candidatus Omnitrophota bacterium]
MKNKSQLLIILEWTLIVGVSFLIARLLNFSLIVPVIILALFSYITFCYKKEKLLTLHLGLLLTIVIVFAKAIVDYSTFSFYYFIPVPAICMLTVVLFDDLALGFAVAATASMLAGNIANNDLSLSLVLFISSIIGMLSVWRARRRSKIIWAGLYVGIVQIFCILLIHLQNPFSNEILRAQAGWIMISGIFASFIVIGSPPIFENLFKVITNISLLELSDFNHPLLRKMILEAPGTYQHSLIVGNLAEAASEAIGANSLLARVGAYYHDIGKIEKAEYFSENQIHLHSKHDKLQPNMSRIIIINHVKEGEELARKYKLNPIIIDFI